LAPRWENVAKLGQPGRTLAQRALLQGAHVQEHGAVLDVSACELKCHERGFIDGYRE